MARVVLTGFPGFLASAFLPHLLARLDHGTSVTCLVQPRYAELARRRAAELATGAWTDRLSIAEGDITRPGLFRDGESPHREDVREIYHFAAAYDLAVSRAQGLNVNVDGTRNVLDFVRECPQFDRLHYVSTCYVSGRLEGQFTESDLSVGQRFNNVYEETKYLAELEVQKRMADSLCATIYRPSIVVGDSRTGATQKYDGPYGALLWVLRWPAVAPMITVGDCRRFRVNMVPRDFVVAAISRLSGCSHSMGKVYHLCDPQPATVDELLRIFGRLTQRRILRVRLPAMLAKAVLHHVPFAYRITRILPESIDYFTLPTSYACDNTLRDLAGSGIACPRFEDYAPALVRFVRENPRIADRGMT